MLNLRNNFVVVVLTLMNLIIYTPLMSDVFVVEISSDGIVEQMIYLSYKWMILVIFEWTHLTRLIQA